MESSNFKIRSFNNSIILEKDEKKIAISQDSNDDIWFRTTDAETTIELKSDYTNWNEWQTFSVFDDLMKLILGKYFLYDVDQKYNLLPKDFIDLENKTITWHSDDESDSKIVFQHNINSIKITIIKEKNIDDYDGNFVKIKASNSKYKNYYKEFILFFRNLSEIEKTLNNLSSSRENENTLVKQKKL